MSQLSIFDAMSDAAGIQSRPAPAAVTPRMVTGDVARRQFVSEFRHTAPYLRRWDVFSDFITLAASELDITRVRTPENIERSHKICDRYQPADLQKLKNLFCLLVAALEGGFQDFLGSVFMELELGSGDMGQFFTPYSLSRLMASVLTGDIEQQLKRCPWVTLDEPTSGAGGMVIAFAEAMLNAGYNPSTQLLVTTTDIDPVAADMTFIQLSLLGIPAIVHTGNTLNLTVSRTRCTPVYWIENWPDRIRSHERIQAMRQFLAGIA